VDDILKLCLGLLAHLRSCAEQAEAHALGEYQQQVGQDQRQGRVSATNEAMGCAIFDLQEWQRGLNKDLNADKCEHAFNTVRKIYVTGEIKATRAFEDQWTDAGGPWTNGIVTVNLRPSHNSRDPICTATEPNT
jgi:hypothetical protein